MRRSQAFLAICFGAPLFLSALMWQAAFWPASMSPDSMMQWKEATLGPIRDIHPALHTLFLKFLLSIAETPALIAFTQYSLLAVAFGWLVAECVKSGAPLRQGLVVSCAVSVLPSVPAAAIYIWKDIPFSAGMLLLASALLRIAHGGENALRAAATWVTLGISVWAVSATRHEGLVVAASCLAGIGLTSRQSRWRVAALSLLIIIAFVGARARVLAALEVPRKPVYDLYSPLVHLLAGHLQAGTDFDASDRELLSRILPADVPWRYDCYSTIPIIELFYVRPGLSMEAWVETGPALGAVALKATARSPIVTLRHQACKTMILWSPLPPTWSSYFGGASPGMIQNPLGLETKPLAPRGVGVALRALEQGSRAPVIAWIVWGSGTLLLLHIVTVAIVVRRCSNHRYWLLLAPAIVLTAVQSAFITTPDFRLRLSVYLLGWATLPLLGAHRLPHGQPRGDGRAGIGQALLPQGRESPTA
jgi:hypothetical protein